MPLLHKNSAFKTLLLNDACAAPQGAGFDLRLRQRVCRQIMVILVQTSRVISYIFSFLSFL
jgi:hypothetical protein